MAENNTKRNNDELQEKVVNVARVAKVVKGRKNF